MTLNFFKTNWFSIALVLLVLAAIARGRGSIFPALDTSRFAAKAPKGATATALGLAYEPTYSATGPQESDQATAVAFFKRFASVAVSERKKFGVPASILLATAFLNSQIGLNESAREANNFFAIPCTQDWEGESVSLDDECYRMYETPWAGWRDFSIYLSSQEWFGAVKQSAGKDALKWAKALNGKDISKVSSFGKKVMEVIEKYKLLDLDQL